MADMDNIESLQESFNYISEALDSMRAQSAVNTGNLDRLMTEISNNLETIANDDTAELIKVFLVELKKGIDDRHNYVTERFSQMEKSFSTVIDQTEKQLTGSEIKELFEIIATNLGGVTRNFDFQKDLINDVSLKIEALQKDDSKKDEILRNISVLKIDLEKVNNGFESTVLNLNENFDEVNKVLKSLDSKEAFSGLKKDIENIFMSSNAILSTMQVIDHKNRELEETINTFVTKEDFNVEREQVAQLIAQNIQIKDYIEKLPTQNNLEDLTDKIDTSIGIINALKNMLTETGKQNQQMLIAQLDSLEAKILNISTEEEFIGFRKELSEFAKEVMESTNLIRADLADTNQGLKSLYEFLNTMDIKNSFLNFTEITKSTEASLKDALTSQSAALTSEMSKNQDSTKNIVLESVTRNKENIEKAKADINEITQSNTAAVLEKIRLTDENINSVKTTIQATNEDNLIAIDEKLVKVKEDVVNTGHFVVQNSQKGLENILTDMDKIFTELLAVKQNVSDSTIINTQETSKSLQTMEERLQQTKEELNHTTKESLDNMLSLVDNFSKTIVKTKDTIEAGYGENTQEIKEIMSGLSLKLNSLQDVLTRGYEVNFADVRSSVEELNNLTQTTKAMMEKNTTFGFSGLSANLEELSNKLIVAEETIDIKSQANLEKIESLFLDLKKEVELSKNFLKESDRSNYDVLAASLSDLNKKIEETRDNINSSLRTEISSVHSSILSLPEIIKQNHIEVAANNTRLIESGATNLKEIIEKIEGLAIAFVTKDNPFKEDVFFNFSELQTKIDTIKQDFNKATFELDDSVSNQINDTLHGIENLVSQYTEKYNSAFGELKGNIQDYFVSVNKIYTESDEKLNNSLSETYEIKAEIENLKERISEVKDDSKIYEVATEIHRRFDAVLHDISEFEQNFSSNSSEFSNTISEELESKFNLVIDEINQAKKSSNGDAKEILIDLGEKTEELKNQLNLTSTDVMNALSSRSTEIASILIAASENIQKVSSINFDEEFMQLKNKVDNVLLSTTEVISKEIEKGNYDQLEKINSEFSQITETLAIILSKVSSDNTREIIELRSILTERVDNISSINNILGTLLDQMSTISNHFERINSNIENSKNEIIEKVDLVENSLVKTHEETRDLINEKTTEIQNRSTAVVLDKIRETSDDLKTTNSQMIYQYKHETKEAIGDLREELLSRPVDFQPMIDTLQTSTQEVILDAKDEILNKAELNGNSLSEAIIETKEQLGERLTSVENSFAHAQDETRNTVLEEITSTKEEIRESLFSKIEDAKDETKRAIVNKLIESQEDSKNNIISGIAEFNDRNNTAILYGIKEHLAQISQELSAEYKEVASENRAEMIYKMTGIADNLEQFGERAKANFESINSKQNEKGEILQNIANNQNENSNLLSQLLNTQSENKNVILDESRQIQETIKLLISDNLTEEQARYREFILNEVSRIQGDSKEEIIQLLTNKDEEITNILLREIRQIQDGIAQGVIENLSINKDSDRYTMLEDMKKIQTESRDVAIEKLVELNDETKRAVVDEIESGLFQVRSVLEKLLSEEENVEEEEISNYQQVEELKNLIESFTNNISEKITENQDLNKNEIEEIITNVKSGFYEKVEDSFDNLKNFIEVLSDKSEINDTFEDLKIAVLNKLSDTASDIDCSIASISLKGELQDFISDVELTIGNVFGQVKEDILSKIDDIKPEDLAEKFEIVEQSVESLKTGVLNEISNKFDEFEINLATQTRGISDINDEISKSVEDLKVVIKDSSVETKEEIVNILEEFKNSVSQTTEKLKSLDFSEKFEELAEISADIIKEEISSISEKLDVLKDKQENSEMSEIVDEVSKDVCMIAQDVRDLLDRIENISPELIEKSEENKANIIEEIDVLTGKLENVIEKAEKAENDRNEIKDNIETLIAVSNDSTTDRSEIKENIEALVLSSNDATKGRNEIKEEIVSIGEKIENLISKSDSPVNLQPDINDSIISIEEKIKSLISMSEETADVSVEDSLKEEIEAVSQKLDLIMLETDSETEEKIDEILIEISGIKEKINLLIEKSDEEIEFDTQNIQTGISTISEKLEEVLQNTQNNSDTATNNDKIEEELAAISQKLDMMMLNETSDNENTIDSNEIIKVLSEKIDAISIPESPELQSEIDINEQVQEIKNIVSSQKSFVEALKNLASSSSKNTNLDFSEIESAIDEKLKSFEEKLTDIALPQSDSIVDDENVIIHSSSVQSEDIKEELENFKSEILESIITIFDQISFIEEAEDIKDFIDEKMEEIKSQMASISRNSSIAAATNSDGSINVNAVLSKVDDDYADIRNEISSIKKHLLEVQNPASEDTDYTLQDVESDIAKVRVILKELSEKKESKTVISNDFSSLELSRITEDLTSISSRTNKILLNSDESYEALRRNLNDLHDTVETFERRVKSIDNKEPINRIDKKLDKINDMVATNVQSDRIFNQTFMYLAEWIDKADEKLENIEQKISDISYVKQNMIKKSDLESMFEKFVKKIDKQQEKIKSLEEKIKDLSKKEAVAKPTTTNIKAIVKEVLSKVETSPIKADSKLVKKVDGIDRQLINLGKSIEKITSYVDD